MSENICPNCGGPRGECRNLFCGPEFEEASLDRNRYQEHLLSDSWQRRRHMVLHRCRGECEARMEGCTGVATQVHHRTYAHFGQEPLWDLAGVCDHCHQALSGPGQRIQEFMESRPEPEEGSIGEVIREDMGEMFARILREAGEMRT